MGRRHNEARQGSDPGDWGRGDDSGGKAFSTEMDRQVRALMEDGELIPPRAVSPSPRQQGAYLNGLKGIDLRAQLRDAGISDRTARRWIKRGVPGRIRHANAEALNGLYWQTRARNLRRTGHDVPADVRQALADQIKERAHGQRIEIEPVDPGDVRPQARGVQARASDRSIRPSNQSWDNLTDAYATGDDIDMENEWMDFAGDIDSPPEAYYEVASIGFMI